MQAAEEKIINPNCLSAVLMGHIKRSCGFENVPESLDLASESGEVIDLASKPREYARKFVEPRTSYILVKVVGVTNPSRPKKGKQNKDVGKNEKQDDKAKSAAIVGKAATFVQPTEDVKKNASVVTPPQQEKQKAANTSAKGSTKKTK